MAATTTLQAAKNNHPASNTNESAVGIIVPLRKRREPASGTGKRLAPANKELVVECESHRAYC